MGYIIPSALSAIHLPLYFGPAASPLYQSSHVDTRLEAYDLHMLFVLGV